MDEVFEILFWLLGVALGGFAVFVMPFVSFISWRRGLRLDREMRALRQEVMQLKRQGIAMPAPAAEAAPTVAPVIVAAPTEPIPEPTIPESTIPESTMPESTMQEPAIVEPAPADASFIPAEAEAPRQPEPKRRPHPHPHRPTRAGISRVASVAASMAGWVVSRSRSRACSW
jgi:hypothetical protein